MTRDALLVGINYVNDPRNRLNGCVNDIIRMKELLLSRGYLHENITMLADDQLTNVKLPTYDNILKALQTLIGHSYRSGTDEIFFHYSGHGTYTKDTNKDELDGRDEMIVPCDMKVIVDDILEKIIERVNPEVTMVNVFDCCHSGTACDLHYQYDFNKHKWNSCERVPIDINKPIYLISGCRDDQTSGDGTVIINNTSSASGMMTGALINCYKPGIDLIELVRAMRSMLRSWEGVDQICMLTSNTTSSYCL